MHTSNQAPIHLRTLASGAIARGKFRLSLYIIWHSIEMIEKLILKLIDL